MEGKILAFFFGNRNVVVSSSSFKIRFIGISSYRYDWVAGQYTLSGPFFGILYFRSACRSGKMYWMYLTTFRNTKVSFRNWGVKLDDSKKKSRLKQFLEGQVPVSKKLSCKRCENRWLPISKSKWISGFFGEDLVSLRRSQVIHFFLFQTSINGNW